MNTDLYTKTVLTVIAVALSIIALRMGFSDPARAMGEACGDSSNPCYIESRYPLEVTAGKNGLEVTGKYGRIDVDVNNWPSSQDVRVQNWP